MKVTPLSRQSRSSSSTLQERDYSAQETCHLLYTATTNVQGITYNFIILSLDGSHTVEDHLEEGQRAAALSIVDHYIGQPDSPHFNTMTLVEFACQFSMPKTLGAEPTPRSRCIVAIP